MAGPRVKLVPVKPAPGPIPVGAAWKNGAGMVKEFIAAAEEKKKREPNTTPAPNEN